MSHEGLASSTFGNSRSIHSFCCKILLQRWFSTTKHCMFHTRTTYSIRMPSENFVTKFYLTSPDHDMTPLSSRFIVPDLVASRSMYSNRAPLHTPFCHFSDRATLEILLDLPLHTLVTRDVSYKRASTEHKNQTTYSEVSVRCNTLPTSCRFP